MICGTRCMKSKRSVVPPTTVPARAWTRSDAVYDSPSQPVDTSTNSQKYDPDIHTNIPKFPLVMPADSFGFSFSGLKSAAIREIQLRASLLQTQTPLGLKDLIEISYGYQETITKILSERLIEAFKKTGAKSMALVG